MKRTIRALLGLVLWAGVACASAQFEPAREWLYSTYAGTNSGFHYLDNVDLQLTGPHAFDDLASQSGGGESAWTRRQGHIQSDEVWLKLSNGTVKRASTAGSMYYDFIANCSRIKLDYDLAMSQIVWWDNVMVRVWDVTTTVMLFEKQTLSELGSTFIDITPGHRYRLYVAINQNNLAWYNGYPEANLSFKAEATITRVLGQMALNINSSSPAADVPITVYTADNSGLRNGLTPFTRIYWEGTSATVGAPATIAAGARAFDHWEQDGTTVGNAKTLTVAMSTAHTITAVFVNAYTLTVNSSGATNVPVTVYQTDANGLKNGTTSFTRIYKSGTTVSLNAPATAGANGFVRWEKDGVSMGASRTLTLPMNAAHTAMAIYAPIRFLSVNSENPASGVPITVWTKDFNGLGNGNTFFERMFLDGRIASMTAPATAGGNYFARWMVDGITATTGKTLSVTMSADKAATAVYLPGQVLTVQATGVVDPVPMVVYQRDINGQQNGTTPFTRLYLQGVNASVTAPATAGGKTFSRWHIDGVPHSSAARTITVNMGVGHMIVAVYQ